MTFLLCRFPPWSDNRTPELLFLGFSDDEEDIGNSGGPWVALGVKAAYRRSLVGVVPRGRLGTWWPPCGSCFAWLHHSSEKRPPSIFSSFGGLLIQELDVHFSPLNPASAVS